MKKASSKEKFQLHCKSLTFPAMRAIGKNCSFRNSDAQSTLNKETDIMQRTNTTSHTLHISFLKKSLVCNNRPPPKTVLLPIP
jgi:hypothetical protein